MNNTPPRPVTRMFPIGTAAYNARWIATFITGSSLLGVSAVAVDNPWTGAVDNNWNNAANWSDIHGFGSPHVPVRGGAHPGDEDALVNSLINFPVVTATTGAVPVPRDVKIGLGGGPGRLDVRGGLVTSGGWMYAGTGGNGNGTINVADTSAAGGTLTGFGPGAGSLRSDDRIYVGGVFGTGTGTLNINTTGNVSAGGRLYVGHGVGGTGTVNLDGGTLAVGNDLAAGIAGGIGVVNFSGGTVTTGGWNFLGKDGTVADGDNGVGGDGTLNITGGTITNTGRQYLGYGNSRGRYNQSGGTYNSNGVFSVGSGNLLNAGDSTFVMTGGTLNSGTFCVGGEGLDNGAAGKGTASITAPAVLNVNGELWVGQRAGSTGTLTLSSGTVSVNNWVAIGRQDGTGTLNMSGGTFTKTGGGNFIVGASGPGTWTQTGGITDIQAGIAWLGEFNVATVSLSGTADFRAPVITVAVNGSSTANFSLDGGTLRTGQMNGGAGNANVNFNGSQIIVTSVQPTFISNLDSANIDGGGLKVDTNGNSVTTGQSFSGIGGVIKSGAGTLTLSGSNAHTGGAVVNAGKLALTPASTGAGNYIVADTAALGINVAFINEQLATDNVSFGTAGATSLDINYGALVGNPTIAPLGVNGTLSINGTAKINLANSLPAVGTFPLVKYNSKTGGNFVLGTLPNGVQATLLHDTVNKVYYLNITSVALPRWDGTFSSKWDVNSTFNWVDQVTNLSSKYLNGNPVLFNDATTIKTVELDATVTPGGITVNNSGGDYTFTSPTTNGKISGTNGLLKQGTAGLTIDLINDYTGKTILEGGTVTVNVLSNGGAPGALGAAPAAPENLVLNGGTLNYAGAPTTIDRGFTVGAGNNTVTSGLIIANDLTISGQIVSGLGKIAKTGAGTLTLTNPGTNVLANGSNDVPGAVRIDEGGLVLNGGGTQVNTVTGEFWVGSTTLNPAFLTLNATTLNTNTWLSIGRGNGTDNFTTTLTATNSKLSTGNISLGFSNGVPGHVATSAAVFNNSTFTTGIANIGESGGSTATLTLNGTSTVTTGDLNVGLLNGSNGSVILNDTSAFNTNNRILIGNETNTLATLTIGGTATFTRTGGYTSIGVAGTGTLVVKESGKLINTVGDFNIGDVANGIGTLELQGNGTVNAGVCYFGKADNSSGTVNLAGGTFTGTSSYFANQPAAAATVNLTGGVLNLGANNEIFIGARGNLVWQQSAGTFNATGWTVIGRFANSNATVNVSGGTFSHVMPARNIIVGEEGTGELTISGTGAVISDGNNGLVVGNGATGTGTVNLDGGTLTVKSIHEGASGSSSVNFNGGLLRAAASSTAAFLTNIDNVLVEAGGANVDSNGQAIAFNVPLLDGGGGGGLIKTGTGTLSLNAANTFTGTTAVSAGILGGTGSVAGPLTVAATGVIAPGAGAVGTFSAKATTLSGSYACEIDGAASDRLVADGTLNVSAATLNITTLTGGATQPAYIIASYTGTTPAPFLAVNNIPAGYTLNYAYNNGVTSTNVALVSSGATPYTTWISGFYPGETNPGIIGSTADPDKDGQPNSLEFALGGSPASGTNNAKIYSLAADSDDGDATRELLMTIAVRSGTPAFTGSPSPSAAKDGFTVTVDGSTGLDTFPTVVTPVGVVATDLPAAPAGYEYRTFSLAGSNGLTTRGFLRVRVAP